MNAPSVCPLARDAVLAERRRSTWVLILLFWLFAFSVLSVRAILVNDAVPLDLMAIRRLISAGFGALMCLGMVWLLARLRNRSFAERVMWGVAGALVMSGLMAAFGAVMNRELFPLPGLPPMNIADTAQWVVVWLGYFLAWTGTHLALSYHWEVEDEQRRAAAMRELAQEARIAALRYQVNPHFLFNALNSISSLVLERRNDEAEGMLLNLSAFLHSALAADHENMIGLEQEIALQRHYLTIEEVRFAERMKVTIDLPRKLADARVPTLILQPLVENAVRHGVDRSEDTTTIRIAAADRDGRLHLIVEDDGGGEAPARRGTGLGLANVRARLEAHFGPDGRLIVAPLPPGGFRAEIELPLAAS